LDKLKMMPGQMRAMARGDSEDDLVNYNKQFNEDMPLDPPGYAKRVAELEAEGMTTSDAQGIADMEYERSEGPWAPKADALSEIRRLSGLK
jgi:hypothetical protein